MATKLLAQPVIENLFEKNKDLLAQLDKTKHKFLIVTSGKDPAGLTYIRQKTKMSRKYGIDTEVLDLSTEPFGKGNTSTYRVIDYVSKFNGPTMVQLPWLNDDVDVQQVINSISPAYDVDGMRKDVWERLITDKIDDNTLLPATPTGIMSLLDDYIERHVIPNLDGMNAVVIGRSNIVGHPIAELLLRQNCTVTICHSHTKDLKEHLRNADLIISSAAQANLFGVSNLKDNTVVIDASFNRNEQDKLCGDFNTNGVENTNIAYTPVPGGVGPMTVSSLILNVIKANLSN